MKLKSIIVDDEPLARDCLRDYIDLVPFIQLSGSFGSAFEASEHMEKYRPDLVFLDINMPRLSGFEWLKSLENPPVVVFTTAYREFAVESYEFNALDYLVKPISQDRFFKTSRKIQAHFSAQKSPSDQTDNEFFIRVDGKLVRIEIDEIMYVESLKDYVKIHLKDGRSYLTLLSLKSLEQKLPDQFIRIHKSFIISLDQVNLIEGNRIQIGTEKLPIGRNLRDRVLSKIVGDKVWKRE